MRYRIIAVTALVLVAACSGKPEDTSGRASIDPSGIPIQHATPMAGAVGAGR